MDLVQEILDPLRFEFMQRALIALVMIGVVFGVMGAYVVTRGMAFLGDALAQGVFFVCAEIIIALHFLLE